MENSKKEFEDAAKKAFKLPSQSNENLLKLYALYKQSTDGDVIGSRPGIFNLKDRAKFDAWTSHKGLSAEEAMKRYVELVKKLST